jgi:hypothetical protein
MTLRRILLTLTLAFLPSMLVVLGMSAVAQERIDLTTPVATTDTQCVIDSLLLLPRQGRIIVRAVLPVSGATLEKVYDSKTTPTGTTLLSQLNQGNFTTNSLEKAVYNRLSVDGVCVGTVAGTPR